MIYTCTKNFIYGNVRQYLAYQAIYEFDIFIDVVMEGMPTAGSPAHMVYEFLCGFFRNESTTLYYNEIKYDLKSNAAASHHANRMQEIARELKK